MTAEKASTLRLLREGMGKQVNVIETVGDDQAHQVRAVLPDCREDGLFAILFLLTSLAFLEATPGPEANEFDGWTPADFLSYLKFDGGELKINLDQVRGRAVSTAICLNPHGELQIHTQGRGQSANRWLSFVRGQRHLAVADHG